MNNESQCCPGCVHYWINTDLYDGSGFPSCKKVNGIDFPHIEELAVHKAVKHMNGDIPCEDFKRKEESRCPTT